MKYTVYIIIFLLQQSLLLSQQFDNNWLMGGECDSSYTEGLVSILNFETNPNLPFPNSLIEYKFSDTNTSISDSSGHLLFYCNGNEVFNWKHELIENGGNLADRGDCGFQNLPQGIVAFPLPQSDNKYFLITASLEILIDANIYTITNMYYSVVDMNENNGEGKLIVRQEPFLQDTLTQGKITACKHANGRDWWLIMFKYDSSQYFKVHFSSNGVESVELSESELPVFAGLGQAVFSPDGTKYAQISGISISQGGYIDIFDFDRCTGELSNHIQEHFSISQSGSYGAAISPSSQFLYFSIRDRIFQYDLWSSDIFASKDTVAVHDGFVEGGFWSTIFYLMQLAPNEKIYITTPSDGHFLHIIHQPDEEGIACDVEQRGLEWPTWKNISLPTFPYYRLGALEGSLCDTFTVAVEEIAEQSPLHIFPNPTSETLKISVEEQSIQSLKFFNATGQLLRSKRDLGSPAILDMFTYKNGIYFLEIYLKDGSRYWEKVVVQR